MSANPIVRHGTWLYDGSVDCEVRIVKSDTADHWNYPDGTTETDRLIDCYYVLWESSAEKGKFSGRAGHFPTITDAIAYVERTTSVRWLS